MVSAKATHSRRRNLREQVCPARRPRASGSSGGCGGQRESGPARWARSRTGGVRSPAHAPSPGVVGDSRRRRHELTTRGVRADRVGAKLSPRGIAARGAGRRKPAGPWPVKPRLEPITSPGGPQGSSRCVRGATRSRFQASARALLWTRWGFGLAGTQSGVEEGNLHGADRGSGGPAVVLADCVDCRSRRAAHGPRLRAPGLASALSRSPATAAPEAKARRGACPGGNVRTGQVPVEAPDRAAQAAREAGGGDTRRWKAPWSEPSRRL